MKKKLNIIYGAPCSGKTTWVQKNKNNNCLIYDFDKIMSAFSGLDNHEKNVHLVKFINSMREDFFSELHTNKEISEGYYITTFLPGNLKYYTQYFDVNYVKIDPTEKICLERVTKRNNYEELIPIIKEWYKNK